MQCRGLEEYMGHFHPIITQLKEMSELHQIMYFVKDFAVAIGSRYTITDVLRFWKSSIYNELWEN